ncbi:MAG: GntR family transcriptional regulator [Bacteroidales bacterium]
MNKPKVPVETVSSSKVQQVVESLHRQIESGVYKAGDTVPSINACSRSLGVSRDTVFKAYASLKKRKILASTPTKGYYVNNVPERVFLLLDSYSPYKDELYHSFIRNLPGKYEVDLAFHHYNYEVFRTLILNSIGKYSAYVIMNPDNGKIAEELRRIDPHKLLLLDWGQLEMEKYSFIGQDFEDSALVCFKKALPLLKKYHEMVVFYPEHSEHPAETVNAFTSFCRKQHLPVKIIQQLGKNDIKRGCMFFVFRPREVVMVLKAVREKKFVPGTDLGILVYNDMPLYEVIDEGMTVISTDFARMGTEAAHFVSGGKKIRKYIPTRFIRRGSL